MSARRFGIILSVTILLAATSGIARPAKPRAARPARAARGAAAPAVPAHPKDLRFPPLDYAAPNRLESRHVLGNGVPVYIVEDHGLPLVDFSITARGGDYMDPDGKAGLAAITCDQMRSGGAGALDADAFDEEADFLALDMSIGSGSRESQASINSLSKDLDRALDLLFLALREPRFQQDRIDLYKTQVRQALERRNDSTTSIENREWMRLMYEGHFESRQTTTTSLDAISRDDMIAFGQALWNPANFVIGVSGDVEAAEILAKLEARFTAWPPGSTAPPTPKPAHRPAKGIWIVDKPDVNQSRVSLGHLSTTWDDPRVPAIDVMNDILGGGGFTSYIMRAVRSDAGLAYSAGSGIGFGREYPRSLRASFQSKNASVARALRITIDQMERIRNTVPTAEDLDVTKNSLIGTFPQRFASPQAKIRVFVNDEIIGRPADWWDKYRPAIKAVTGEDVKRVANELLHPDDLTILVVGKKAEVLAGEADHPDFSIAKMAGPQGIIDIPLPDPGTMIYP